MFVLAKFKCCFGGDPLPTVIWSHNQCSIDEKTATNSTDAQRYRTHQWHDIHYLSIESIEQHDHGEIKCTISNRFGCEEITAELLIVRKSMSNMLPSYRQLNMCVLATRADATPYIVQPLTDAVIVDGQSLIVSCSIHGLQVTINWLHNGKVTHLVIFCSTQMFKQTFVLCHVKLISSMNNVKQNYRGENILLHLVNVCCRLCVRLSTLVCF
jgi:hypothetical protein